MASSRSVNESTLDLGIKNPVNLLQRNLTSNPRLTIKMCKSDAIAAVMQVLNFFSFWRTAQLSFVHVLVLYRLLLEMNRTTIAMSHMIGARRIGDSRKGDREATDSQRRGPRRKNFGNLCCGVLGLLIIATIWLQHDNTLIRLNLIIVPQSFNCDMKEKSALPHKKLARIAN